MSEQQRPEVRRKTLSEVLKEKALAKGQVYHVRWQGGKMPAGLQLNNYVITEVKGGEVWAAKPDNPQYKTPVGTYDRLVEFGGEHKDEQEVIVYVSEDPTTPPTFDTKQFNFLGGNTENLSVNRVEPQEALKLTLSSLPAAGNGPR